MNNFDYVRPATVADAVKAAAEPGAAYLAAGTNLIDLMKGRVATPARLVDITHLPGLDRIERLSDGGVRIGALVRNADLAHDVDFARAYPAVAEALLSGASAQLRNAATVGGNLLQRTRCAYFYDAASACNKREPGFGCDARQGENRLHAVLGWSDACIATHPSDFCVPLVALGAVVEIEGQGGRREIPLDELYRLPGDAPQKETTLEAGDLIVAVRLPAEAASFASHARYIKLRERTSYAFALVSAAAALRIEGGMIAEARLALGGVAPKPWRTRPAEEALAGAAPGEVAFRRAAETALAEAKPSGDNAFKIELARRVLVRALTLAAAGTPEHIPALPAGGSAHTATAGMAIHNAGADVIARLAALATGDERSPLFGAGNAGVVARGGRLFRRDDETRSESYADILGRAGCVEIEGRGKGAVDPAAQETYAMHAHGAVFAEVKVDPDLGQIRVTRLVGAFAAGRVINPRLVRSQYYGGMIWGVSFALHEEAVIDHRSGRIINANLGDYHVPVNADIPSIEALLIEEHDPYVNALGIKGVGEIGITGSAGAVANAVWHATGIRPRRFPIRIEDLLGAAA